MIKIIKLIDQLRDRLAWDYSNDEDGDDIIFEIIDNIEKEVRKPIKIYRNKDRWIYDVQPSYGWTTIDKSGEKEKEKEKEKVGQIGENLREKTLNLAKLTE